MKNRHLFFSAVLVLIAAWAAYLPALDNGFCTVWDDQKYIVENPAVTGLTLENIKTAFTNTYVGNYAPLHIVSYAVDYTLFGMNPAAFHAVNNFLHAVNAVLVLLLIFHISDDLFFSLGSALIFALHPVQVESVAWLTERKNVLSAAFALGSFLAYTRFLSGRSTRAYAASLLFFAFGLLTKSSIVTLPLLLCVYSVLYDRPRLSVLVPVIPFFVFSAAAAALTVITQDEAIVDYHGGSPYATALTMVTLLVRYLRLFLFPVGLSPLYEPVIYREISVPVVMCLLVLASLAFFLWTKRKDRDMLFMASWAFIPLLPVLQIIPIVTLINDRFLYLPAIGLAYLVARVIRGAAGKLKWVVLTLAVLLMLSQTVPRADLWNEGPDLWLDAIRYYPGNSALYSKLAEAYHSMGKVDEAREAYEKTLEIRPGDLEARKRYGAVLMQSGRYKEALEELRTVYEAGVKDEELISNLGYAYMDVGEVERGMKYHKEVLRIDPGHTNSLYGMALGYEKLGDPDNAVFYWRMFLDKAPGSNPWRDKARARLEDALQKRSITPRR